MPKHYEDDIDKLMEELLEGIDLSEEAPEDEFLDMEITDQEATEELYFETEDEDEDQPQSKGKGLKILLVVLCVVLGIAVVAFGAYTAIGMLTGQTETPIVLNTEEVPSLIGMDYDSLPEGMKVTVVKGGEEYSDTLPAGQILSQEPAAGTSVEAGSEVSVVVSLGKEPVKVTIPDTLVGMTLEEAEQWLKSQEITLNVTTETAISDGEAGLVMKTTPEVGALLSDGETVLLTISKGNTAQVPKVTGMTEAEALEALKTAGFENVKTVKIKSEEPKDTVLTQSMGEGQSMKVANLIVLRVSGGSENSEDEAQVQAAAETEPAETQPEETEPAEESTEETTEPEETDAAETDPTEETEV